MIEINNLTKEYGDVVAVNNLSLSIPAGELFCFLGPNGAGKTTTIKVMTGLLKPTNGTASINGHDVQTASVESKKLIGYIPDMPYVYERLTTTEFYAFTGDLYSIDSDYVASELEKSFDLFGLLNYKDTLVKDLSHGLKQRLLYASAFLHDPRVLFIDEPLIGLDPYTIRLIKDLLREKTANGMTIFLTTHILPLVQDIADRVGIIAHGKLIALGTIKELLKQNKSKDLEETFLKLTSD